MSRATLEELHSLPGVCKEQDPATKGFVMQQTMLRIKDPEPTLDFYTRVLGMSLLTRLDFKDLGFSLEAANAAMFVDWDLFIQDPSSE